MATPDRADPTPAVLAMLDDGSPTAPLDEFLAAYDQDDNWWWRIEHQQNLFDQAVERIEELQARIDAVTAMHVPYFEVNGGRLPNTVIALCGDAGCSGTDEQPCEDSADGEHEVPACVECHCLGADYGPGYLLWPCPTRRALTGDDT